MLFRLLLLFILVPFVELVLLLQLADWTSPLATLTLIVITGVVGSLLARSQGFRVWQEIRRQLASGQMPTRSLVDGAMILVAGALLLTPGILTDAFGLSLLVPQCRRLYRSWLLRRFRNRFRVTNFGQSHPDARPGRSEVIDSYVVDSSESPRDNTQ